MIHLIINFLALIDVWKIIFFYYFENNRYNDALKTIKNLLNYEQDIVAQNNKKAKKISDNRKYLNMEGIYDYALNVDLADVRDVLKRQLDYNVAIAKEGLKGDYGANIGKVLLKTYGDDVTTKAKALTAAGSDARMNGCEMPVIVNDFILSITESKYMFLFMVTVLLLIMGMFMDGGASVIILAPILAPVAASMDISLIQFGLIMCFNLTIGNITPPLGYCLFITAKIAGIPVEKAVKGTLPYMIAEILTLLLITYVPFMTLALPEYLGMSV